MQKPAGVVRQHHPSSHPVSRHEPKADPLDRLAGRFSPLTPSTSLTPESVLSLQRLAGNAAVSGLLTRQSAPRPTTSRGEAAVTLQRFPGNAVATPVPWRQLTGDVKHPGEGVSGGIYILTSNQKDPEVKTIIAKPVMGQSGVGTTESSAQMTFGDEALAQLFGINTPLSRGVSKGSTEFDDLVAVCSPKAAQGDNLADAKSFIVMTEVPKATSLRGLAEKSATDAGASQVLSQAVFSSMFLEQMGRVCVADLLVGNNDRMVAGAMNIGNFMVSSAGSTPQLWAIDTNAFLGGNVDPVHIVKQGSASESLQGGFSNTTSTLKSGPGELIDGFFQTLAETIRQAAPAPTGDAKQASSSSSVDPAATIMATYQAKHDEIHAAFQRGWDSGLAITRQLAETKAGRQTMKQLTEAFAGDQGSENVKYEALKANAMYLGAKSTGATHEEAAQDPASYLAVRFLAGFDPTTIRIPHDEFYWDAASPPPADAYSASLPRIKALPHPKIINDVRRGRELNDTGLAKIGTAAENAKTEVEQLGKKTRGVFSRSEQTRNRTFAGRFIASTYLLGGGAGRAYVSAYSFSRLADQVKLAAGGKLKPSGADSALPAAEFLQTYRRPLERELVMYIDELTWAANSVTKIGRYERRDLLAQALTEVATSVGYALTELQSPELDNLQIYVNALKGAKQG
jgi:hypothetical protein